MNSDLIMLKLLTSKRKMKKENNREDKAGKAKLKGGP